MALSEQNAIKLKEKRKWKKIESESKRVCEKKRESESVSEKRPVLVYIAFFILLYLLKENSNVIKWTHFPSWPWRIKAYYTFGLGWKYPPV